MATGSEKRGTRKTRRGYRTPKLSDAEKRRRSLDRRMDTFGKKSGPVGANEVPF